MILLKNRRKTLARHFANCEVTRNESNPAPVRKRGPKPTGGTVDWTENRGAWKASSEWRVPPARQQTQPVDSQAGQSFDAVSLAGGGCCNTWRGC